ncbi:MAG: DNA cytosine methyltransferase, partial [Phycisphaerales bacterium]
TEIPKGDIVWASFPCQDLSLAGKMGGLAASRSGLLWEWLRVLDEMPSKPPVLALENVVGLLSANGGQDYRLLIFSFDHRETPRRANLERQAFLLKFQQEPLDKGIEFWTGNSENIMALTDAVGFGYRFMPGSGHFSHTSAMIFLRNDGTIHNYLPGSEYSPTQVRTGVTEATENRRATIWDQVVLLCRVMDESTGEYVISPMRVMQLVGGLSVVVVFGGIAALVITGRFKGRPVF